MSPALQKSNQEQLIEDHRKWLSAFDSRYLVNWQKLLGNNNEAALCEAAMRIFFEKQGLEVQPNEKLDPPQQGGPDFRCSTDDCHFYVDATCITWATAQGWVKKGRKTLADRCRPDTIGMWEMARAASGECKKKAAQCAGRDAPVLVAIGTFHAIAARTGLKRVPMSGLLTGKTAMTWDIDPHIAAPVGNTCAKTELQWSLPLRPDQEQDLAYARCSISGVLVFNLSDLSDIKSRGVLHPSPVRAFSRSLLPDIEFGEIEVDRRSGQLRVRWARGKEE